ncbi:MAG: pyridoxamine 5'-phosphate oxidase family protein [Coriobacteriia bacterium]|nr:pyridoxamine 5'-phosphate oxidase family protein [Coriobacteriia bacterium]
MTHELRRHDLEITDPAEIDRILRAARYATIALADGDQPYAVTLSCGYDADRRRLCFHIAPKGRKLDIIAANPAACATVIGDLGYKVGECAHPYESVVMSGRMRVLEDPGDIRAGMRTLVSQLESPEDEVEIWERNKLDTPEALKRFRMLVFEIDELTAKTGQ